MQHHPGARSSGFEVLGNFEGGQAAWMALPPKGNSGEYGSEHPGSVQVLIVVKGEGSALIEGREISLSSGDLLVVERGEKHQIRAGASGLQTMNVYLPPAYTAEGEPV